MHFHQLIRHLINWLWLIIACMIIVGIGVYAITDKMPRVYRAGTTFSVGLGSNSFNSSDQERLLGTYSQLATKEPILTTVISKLNLGLLPGDLQEHITVRTSRNTLLITLLVEDNDPVRAAAIANSIVETLDDQSRALLGNDRLIRQSVVQLIEPARPIRSPISPRVMRSSVIAAAFGGMLALGIVVLTGLLDHIVRSREQVEEMIGKPVLATIPIPGWHGLHGREPLSLTKPGSAVGETYRLLVARLDREALMGDGRTICVVSVGPDQGGGVVAANMAIEAARTGKQVILVDSNFRKPEQHRWFTCSGERGLGDLLMQHTAADVHDYVIETQVANLRLLPTGTAVEPFALGLTFEHLTHIWRQLRTHADLLIVDSAPLLAASEATVVAGSCDATLLITRAGETSLEQVRRAYEHLEDFRIMAAGIVITNVDAANVSLYSRRTILPTRKPITPTDKATQPATGMPIANRRLSSSYAEHMETHEH
jgi:capsular exopolysaccharide synthesis family protein